MRSFRKYWNSLVRRRKSSSESTNYGWQISRRLDSTRPSSEQGRQIEFQQAIEDAVADAAKEPWRWVPQFGRGGRNRAPLFPNCYEQPSGMYRRCDLCPFEVRNDDVNVLNWALRDHMFREHPTKGRR